VAPQRLTYEVKGQPTAYYLVEPFQNMIQGLVACVDQRELQQCKFLPMMSISDGMIEIHQDLFVNIQQLSKKATRMIQIHHQSRQILMPENSMTYYIYFLGYNLTFHHENIFFNRTM